MGALNVAARNGARPWLGQREYSLTTAQRFGDEAPDLSRAPADA